MDTDHGAAGTSDTGYVWSAFTRGYHFNLYDKPFENPSAEGPQWRIVRQNIGKAVEYSNKLDLVNVTPREDLASTHFCLAKPGHQYVVYQPDNGPITVSALRVDTFYNYEFFDSKQGKVVARGRIRAAAPSDSFSPVGSGTVLYISSKIN